MKKFIIKWIAKSSLVITGALFVVSAPVLSIEIDAMFKLSEEDNSTTYTITNNGNSRIYLNTIMNELKVDGEEIHKTKYTRENLSDWKATISPSQMVLNPGFEGRFRVEYRCENCEEDVERVFQINFVPSPYVKDDNESQHRVGVSVGFAPIFVKYSGGDDMEYEASLNGDRVTIINHGKSFIRAKVTFCDDKDKGNACEMNVNVLAGRKLTFKLPLAPEIASLDLASAKNKLKENVLLRNSTFPNAENGVIVRETD